MVITMQPLLKRDNTNTMSIEIRYKERILDLTLIEAINMARDILYLTGAQ
jgi:hypothetical protein